MIVRVDFFGLSLNGNAFVKRTNMVHNCYACFVATIPVANVLLIVLDVVSKPRDVVNIVFIFVCVT